MQPQTKQCQNCKNDFVIETDDFSFYEKIKVPPPTFCPGCRMIRRLVWRNNRSLHRRPCDSCGKILIGMYAPTGAPMFCVDCYNGDGWNRFEYGRDIDWSRNFLIQIYELFQQQPRIFQYRLGTVVNSDFGNSVVNSKDIYLGYSIIDSENIQYSESVDRSKDSIDCLIAHDLDSCSWNICSDKNYNSHFLVNSQSNMDSYFLFDCINCQQCCLSSNLRNQSYVFKNQKLTKEEYLEKVSALELDTVKGFNSATQEFKNIIEASIHRYAQIYGSVQATGDFISNAKNVTKSFDIQNAEDIRHSERIINSKDLMDCYAILTGELEYESMSGSSNSYAQIACMLCFTSKNIEYSMFCKNCSDCFGCIGLKDSKYCILNKQYTKEEYFEIVARLRQYMIDVPYVDSKGRVFTYGEFYPYEFSPFSYDETIAQYYQPLSSDQIVEHGFVLKPKEKRQHAATVHPSSFVDSIDTVSDSILGEVIECSHGGNCEHQCTEAFRVTPIELTFLKNKGLPLPQKCPNCRHYQRLEFCNPYTLWTRTCSNGCGRVFESTYSPDRPEKVYCKECYQQAVI